MAADDQHTRESTVRQIERLVEEIRHERASWENGSLDDYLDALGAWLGSCAGYYRNNFGSDAPDNPWRIISDALDAARTYE